jgi:phosphate transport system substrate-binding protein
MKRMFQSIFPQRQMTHHSIMACVLMALAMLAPQAQAQPQKLLMGGSGGDLATMRIMGKAYERSHPGVVVEVLPSLGSGGGIKAVLAGAIGLSISSRPVKDKERAKGARSRPYANTALVFTIPENAPYRDITSSGALEIYSGKILSWPDGKQVRLVLRPPIDGDYRILASSIDGMGKAMAKAAKRKHLPVAITDQDNARKIESLSGGLGITSLSQILTENRALRPLSLDGIVASAETIASGTYPVIKTFHLVTGPAVSDLASDFIVFINSPEGVGILRRTGHAETFIQAAQN